MISASMQRFLLLQVINPHYHRDDALENMRELSMLVDTYGGEIVEKSVQHRVKPHPATYIGPGKLEWVKEEVKANEIDVVVLNDILNPALLFRVEKSLWSTDRQVEVWDRVDLILNIFEKHAHSKEAKLQIELARLSHAGPRIYGLGGTVLSRQGGGIGTRGKGETNIEFERRLIKDKTALIKRQLKHLSEYHPSCCQIHVSPGWFVFAKILKFCTLRPSKTRPIVLSHYGTLTSCPLISPSG